MVLCTLAVAALFAWNVERTWSLGDDAFISFRYAENLSDGLGLVWNVGERVEGYTNFSWVLLLAAGMELGLAPEVLSNLLGVACGALLLVALQRFAARGRAHSSLFPWLLVLVLAASRSFAAWCTGGLETMLFTLLVFLGYARLFAPWKRERRDALGCGLLFAGAALTRPEGILFGGLAFALLALEVLRRRRSRRAALLWLAPFTLVVAGHFLWRRGYYGEWLPNTFYAKVGGLWLEQGRRYFAYFHDCYRIGWFTPLALVALFGPRRREAAAVLFVLAVYGAYVLAVGGDVFELRFFVHVFPLVYWLLVEGLAVLAALPRAPAAGRVLAALGALALLVTTQLGFERVPANHYGLQSVEGITEYTRMRVEEGRTLRRFIEAGVLPREVVLCVGGAGAVPYYTRWTTVDRRGLNDATIARTPVGGRGFVAHEHDAPHEYLVARGVVVFDVFNNLLVQRRGLRSLAKQEPFHHDGRVLTMRALTLDERALVFATFVDDAELARRFPGARVLALDDG
ncbi:MAG: hypothetical protein HOP15_17825 [Planctomycetes bacterium]|nr:hypothetical protein [Planctomycetota bacterium]